MRNKTLLLTKFTNLGIFTNLCEHVKWWYDKYKLNVSSSHVSLVPSVIFFLTKKSRLKKNKIRDWNNYEKPKSKFEEEKTVSIYFVSDQLPTEKEEKQDPCRWYSHPLKNTACLYWPPSEHDIPHATYRGGMG